MTPQEIIDGNKLIAEFMAMEVYGIFETGGNPLKATYHSSQISLFESKGYKVQLLFHSSWDWLIPVVKKCSESFEYNQYDSEEYYHITKEIFHPDYSLSEFMDADIEAIYIRVVTYIKWYNQNKENV